MFDLDWKSVGSSMLDWKSLSSMVATIIFIRSLIREFMPHEVTQFLKVLSIKLFSSVRTNISILIDEYDSNYNNELFDSIQAYLSSKCFSTVQILKLSKPKNSKNLTFTMESDQKVQDNFQGIPLKWTLCTHEKKPSGYGYGGGRPDETYHFKLSFHKKHKQMIHSLYLPYVIEEATRIKFKNRERRIYSNSSSQEYGRPWGKVTFAHPSNFDTLALDPALKEEIKADLSKFVSRREFYTRVGRAWKRGYLLYGPPGTGKTSLIAAIANFLEFDIYDLELTAVSSNSQLRKLLIATSSKSVIVVEDVDCSLDLSDRKKKEKKVKEEGGDGEEEEEKKKKKKNKEEGKSPDSTVSLSGVLNFVDGLWSSCVGERLMIFTTNHKDKLDAALLRAGRMDKHIYLGHCEFKAFLILAKNYLGIDDHELMKEVEEVLPAAKMTPADVAEIFMSCNDDIELGMRNVLEEMKKRVAALAEEKMEKEKKIEMEGVEKEKVVTEEDVTEKNEEKMKEEEKKDEELKA